MVEEKKEVVPTRKSTKRITNWETRFNELQDYKALHGNCNVPRNYQHNKQLGLWVYNQRQ